MPITASGIATWGFDLLGEERRKLAFKQFLLAGERVTVAPPAGGGVTINVNGPGGRELAAIMQRHAEAAIEEYHNTVITPWSNGAG